MPFPPINPDPAESFVRHLLKGYYHPTSEDQRLRAEEMDDLDSRIQTLAQWMAERDQELGNYSYAAVALEGRKSGVMDHLNMDYLWDSGACVVGDPDRCIELAKRYEAVGCDLLLCLFNPYKMKHEDVMESIELMGKHVLPEFAD